MPTDVQFASPAHLLRLKSVELGCLYSEFWHMDKDPHKFWTRTLITQVSLIVFLVGVGGAFYWFSNTPPKYTKTEHDQQLTKARITGSSGTRGP